jgi:ACR3 family arsenite transporter
MFSELSLMDKLLTPIILLSMIVGVIIGEFVPGVQKAFDVVRFDKVSVREYPHMYTDPAC